MTWIVRFVILALLVEGCLCCSCMPYNSVQEAYCDSYVAIRGKAVNVTTIDTLGWYSKRDAYTIEVTEVYKTDDNLQIEDGVIIKAVTSSYDSLCGGWLELNTDLIITGNGGRNGDLNFGLCDFMENADELTDSELQGLEGQYTCE